MTFYNRIKPGSLPGVIYIFFKQPKYTGNSLTDKNTNPQYIATYQFSNTN